MTKSSKTFNVGDLVIIEDKHWLDSSLTKYEHLHVVELHNKSGHIRVTHPEVQLRWWVPKDCAVHVNTNLQKLKGNYA